MDSLIKIQKKLLPDMLSVMQRRYQVLRSIKLSEPVGRRTLAQMLGWTERVLRSEAEFLQGQNLIHIKSSGMTVTEEGKDTLMQLEGMMKEISGITTMEEQLKKQLHAAGVVIVPGNSDESPWVKEELGRACTEQIGRNLRDRNIIAVTGGTTMAAAASLMDSVDAKGKELLFVPARGGIGEDVQNQANTICSTMAYRTSSRHRVLYVPDQVGQEMRESLMREPAIKEVLQLIKSANIVLHGIGEAMKMAERRNTSEEDMRKIAEGHAVGEAFGYYFDVQGNIVHKVPTVGLQLSDLPNAEHVLAAAGGKSKANAIRAYMNSAPPSTILITDEGAAEELLKGETF